MLERDSNFTTFNGIRNAESMSLVDAYARRIRVTSRDSIIRRVWHHAHSILTLTSTTSTEDLSECGPCSIHIYAAIYTDLQYMHYVHETS